MPDKRHLRISTPDGRDVLRIPAFINIRDLHGTRLDELLTVATEHLDATFFRDQAVFFSVLEDKRQAAQKPQNFLPGPFLQVFVRQMRGELGLSVADKPEAGSTVYAADQFLDLARRLSPEQVDQALDDSLPPPIIPRKPYATDWQTLDDNGLEYSREIDRYWFQGRTYDPGSAAHNGLIGPGAQLRKIAAADRAAEDDGPTP